MKTKINYEEDYKNFSKIEIEINGFNYHIYEEYGKLTISKEKINRPTESIKITAESAITITIE